MRGSYTVEWWDDATNDLAARWNAAADKEAVTVAAAAIDDRLARQPLETGREVAEGLRRIDHGPLRVYFHVVTEQQRVEVVGVGSSPSESE